LTTVLESVTKSIRRQFPLTTGIHIELFDKCPDRASEIRMEEGKTD
jgi:hypothetical protein